MKKELLQFKIKDLVCKVGGDYSFTGVVVSAFQKRSGAARYVVENVDGLLHIFSGKQLTLEIPSAACQRARLPDEDRRLHKALDILFPMANTYAHEHPGRQRDQLLKEAKQLSNRL